jgi:uncharacterized membrane protein
MIVHPGDGQRTQEEAMRTFAIVIAALAAAFYLVFGIWAFVDPESFFENIATYPPYNEHLIHDLGAFQIGLGVAGLAGLALSDGLAATLAGIAAGSLMHGVSHIGDTDLGGRDIDPWGTSLLGLVALLGFAAAAKRRQSVRSR